MLSEQAQRLASLIEQLLDLSRIEAQARRDPAGAMRVAARLEQLLKTVAAGHRDLVEVVVDPELEALVDPTSSTGWCPTWS